MKALVYKKSRNINFSIGLVCLKCKSLSIQWTQFIFNSNLPVHHRTIEICSIFLLVASFRSAISSNATTAFFRASMKRTPKIKIYFLERDRSCESCVWYQETQNKYFSDEISTENDRTDNRVKAGGDKISLSPCIDRFMRDFLSFFLETQRGFLGKSRFDLLRVDFGYPIWRQGTDCHWDSCVL